MDFEWDEAKNRLNIERHGISFEDAALIFEGLVATRFSPRSGEDRWVAIGLLESFIVAVVYTDRGDTRRLISARRATPKERHAYQKAIADRLEPPAPPD